MSAIGDYIYFTTYGYENGEEPFHGYKNALSRKQALNVFEKKRKEIVKSVKAPITNNQILEVKKYFNLATRLTSGKTINDKGLSPEEYTFIHLFPEIFKEKMQEGNFGAQYTGLGKAQYEGLNSKNKNYIKELINNIKLKNQDSLKLDKELKISGNEWIKRIDEIYKLLTNKVNGAEIQKWLAGSLGKEDINSYVNDFKQLHNLLKKLNKNILKNEAHFNKIVNEMFSYDRNKKITKKEIGQLRIWLDAVSKNETVGFVLQDKLNGDSLNEENVFSQMRYLSHVFFEPSFQGLNSLAEIFGAAVHATMYAVSVRTARQSVSKIANVVGKQTSHLYVKKEDLSKELANKFYSEGLEVKDIGGVDMIKLPNATQNKIDVLFKQPLANINTPDITIGESIKRTGTKGDKNIKFLTGGNLYNLIGNENDNLFLTHYVNNFASQIQRKSEGIPQRFSNIHTREKDKISKTGDLAMKAIYAHHGLTGEGTLKYNDDGTPLAGASLLSWYDADLGVWKVKSIQNILNDLNKSDYKWLSIERKLYKSGNNDRTFTSNMFPVGVLPFKPESFDADNNNANMGVVRRRINSILSHLHGSSITLALSHVQNWLK